MRHAVLLASVALPILLCPALAQSAKDHYAAGERAVKDAKWVEAGREFEQAARMAPDNQGYQARFAEVRIKSSEWAESAAELLLGAGRAGEARAFVEEALHFDPRNAAAAELLVRLKAPIGPPVPGSPPTQLSAPVLGQGQASMPLGPSTSAKMAGDSRTPIPAGITVCLQPMTGGFDAFLTGEMEKQQVPVVIIATISNAVQPGGPEVCDPAKSLYTMSGTIVPEGKSLSARTILGLRLHFRDEVQAAVKLVRNSDNAIVWAGDSDRGEAKKVAEHIVNQMLKQRPNWFPSPLNR